VSRPWLLLLAICPVWAQMELHLEYGMLQKLIATQAFSEDGRRYVRGDKSNRCNHAYLENPQVGESGGRLLVRARFSGRTALNVLGQCVGVGDSFDVAIRMVPYADRSILRLRDVQVSTGGSRGVYSRAVGSALAETIPRVLRYDLAPEFRGILESEQPGIPFRRTVDNFQVQGIRVGKEALVLQVGLKLILR
jgi:hypothetical protein